VNCFGDLTTVMTVSWSAASHHTLVAINLAGQVSGLPEANVSVPEGT